MKTLCFAAFVIALLPLVSYSLYVPSTATYGPPNQNGACGYGGYGVTGNGGLVTGVAYNPLWRNGTACGDCYQVICTDPTVCNTEGVTVLVTNQGGNGFVMSPTAFAGMTRPDVLASILLGRGNVGVVYQRVPCAFPGSNVLIRITSDSRFPNYLSLAFLNVGGLNDINAVQVQGPGEGGWIALGRVYGEVFATPSPPLYGPLSVRVMFRGSAGLAWWLAPNVIPTVWAPGQIYTTNFQLT